MFSRIYNAWVTIRGSLWFLPVLLSLCYMMGVLALYLLERAYFSDIEFLNYLYNGTAAEAKELVTILLSAMITMTTLVISITMVVLSLAATQLGPRLIRSFMGDRQTQLFIGLFFGSVVACFVLTGILHDKSLTVDVPRLAVSGVIFCCFINLFLLLGFFNHLAESSIADKVIENVADDLFDAIRRLADAGEKFADTEGAQLPPHIAGDGRGVALKQNGYLQYVDYPKLLGLAEKNEVYIKVNIRAGRYMVYGESAVTIYPDQELDPEFEKSIRNAFLIGTYRTPTQDVEYSIRHLVEIALRALSPGINDHFTAVSVLDRLTAALAFLFENGPARYILADQNGVIRVEGASATARDITSTAFSQIRHAGNSQPDIIRHLLGKIRTLLVLADSDSEKEGLRSELELIRQDITSNFPEGDIRQELLRHYQAVASI